MKFIIIKNYTLLGTEYFTVKKRWLCFHTTPSWFRDCFGYVEHYPTLKSARNHIETYIQTEMRKKLKPIIVEELSYPKL